MSGSKSEEFCDWTVSGMDCGSCATKIKDAVSRLPGVSDVQVAIMSERLRLTLDEAQTGRDKVEKTVRALGYGIEPRKAGAKKIMPLSGATGKGVKPMLRALLKVIDEARAEEAAPKEPAPWSPS